MCQNVQDYKNCLNNVLMSDPNIIFIYKFHKTATLKFIESQVFSSTYFWQCNYLIEQFPRMLTSLERQITNVKNKGQMIF